MSIFNKVQTPVRFLRSLFFLFIFICAFAELGERASYAKQITQEEWLEEPGIVVVREIREEKWKSEDKFILIFILLLLGTGMLLWLFLMLCTIGFYVENAKGKMEYVGRQRIRYNEFYFEIVIPMESIDKCVTTHFLFCPSLLFIILFREKDMAFLFPEEICMIKQVKRNIEISLL